MYLVSKTVQILGPFGGYALARHLCRKQPRILMYHRFSDPPMKNWSSPGCFEKQVKHIITHYRPFSLVGLIGYANRHGRMPENAVVITVDDGYRDFYDYAFPILYDYGVPATLFITTGFVDGRLWLWPDQIAWLLKNARQVTTDATFGSTSLREGQSCETLFDDCWQTLATYGLSITEDEKYTFIAHLAKTLNLELPDAVPLEFAPISWEQLREIEAAGIEVGGHTVTHPNFGHVTETQARDEIFGCRDEIVKHLGDKSRTFCYPNGKLSDFQDFIVPLVKQAGFVGAVTAFPDAKGTNDRFTMRRHVGGDDMFQFNKSVSGVEYLGHLMRGNVLKI